MAPGSTFGQCGQEEREGAAGRKLRKPAAEKVRRDRINSRINQLRLLLQKEFEEQQLPAKAEKADILELAVRCLARGRQRAAAVASREGYSSCLQHSLHFLSLHEAPKETQREHLGALQGPVAAAEDASTSRPPSHTSSTEAAPGESPKGPWRPW